LRILILNAQLRMLIEPFAIGQTRYFKLLKLQPHGLILLLKFFHLASASGHLLKLSVLLLQMEQLLVNVARTSSPLEVKYLLQMLDLLLQLLDVYIISGTHLVGLHLHHDLLGSVRKLQS
jgi:hypothetical protein